MFVLNCDLAPALITLLQRSQSNKKYVLQALAIVSVERLTIDNLNLSDWSMLRAWFNPNPTSLNLGGFNVKETRLLMMGFIKLIRLLDRPEALCLMFDDAEIRATQFNITDAFALLTKLDLLSPAPHKIGFYFNPVTPPIKVDPLGLFTDTNPNRKPILKESLPFEIRNTFKVIDSKSKVGKAKTRKLATKNIKCRK